MDTLKTQTKPRQIKKIMTATNSSTIKVQKRDGRLENLDINKIHFVVEEACFFAIPLRSLIFLKRLISTISMPVPIIIFLKS